MSHTFEISCVIMVHVHVVLFNGDVMLSIMQDISYYCCTEISGEQSNIVSSLSPLFSKETGKRSTYWTMYVCTYVYSHRLIIILLLCMYVIIIHACTCILQA